MTKTRLILTMVAVLAITMGLASAQITGEPMEGKTRNHNTAGGGNVFGCPTTGNAGSPACDNGAGGTITYRFYSPENASNGGINPSPVVDGNPIFQTGAANGSYLSDVENSANLFGAGHAANLQVNLIWDAQLRGGTGDHAGFYAGQSQLIVSNGETGNTNLGTCIGTRGIACFSVVSGANATDPTDTPQGAISQEGGMRGVPVPTVSDGSTPGQVALSWLDPSNEYTIDGAAGPVTGVELFARTDTGILDSRAVTDADLDGNAQMIGFFAKGTDGGTTVTCASLGDPGTYIPVTRVRYQNNAGTGAMVGFWSANGPTIRCNDALFTEVVNFKAMYLGKLRGEYQIEISWETTAEDGTIGFNLLRGESLAGPFTKVANLPAQGQGGEGAFYSLQDLAKLQGNVREVFYKLQVIEADGGDTPVGPVRTIIEKQTGKAN